VYEGMELIGVAVGIIEALRAAVGIAVARGGAVGLVEVGE